MQVRMFAFQNPKYTCCFQPKYTHLGFELSGESGIMQYVGNEIISNFLNIKVRGGILKET